MELRRRARCSVKHVPLGAMAARCPFFAGAAMLAIAVLVLGAACGDESASPQPAPTEQPLGEDPGLIHVHGLDVDPATGTIFAATHTGLFRIEGGEAHRVGDRFQDTMGFTIDENGRFLGSGHPDLRDLRSGRFKPLLGLVESKDKGASWTTVSLSGEADFHALQAAHGRLFGYDATNRRLMVSRDGKAWETRSTVAVYDFAVSPTDPEHLLAAFQAGVAESRDGGRTWSVPTAPTAALVAWTTSGQWAIGPDGSVSTRTAGLAWEPRGTLQGEPEALFVNGSELFAAVQERGILASADGGRTWTVLVPPG